jgi:hypothetical protein
MWQFRGQRAVLGGWAPQRATLAMLAAALAAIFVLASAPGARASTSYVSVESLR